MDKPWDLTIPPPCYAATDDDAKRLLDYLQYRLHAFPSEPYGFDTETHGLALPFKIGTSKVLDWTRDTVTFWSLAYQLEDGTYQRWCLQGQHLYLFQPFLEDPRAILAVWNLKYDAHVCWNSGINLWNARPIDAMAMCAIDNENLIGRGRLGLKDVMFTMLGIKMKTFDELFDGVVDETGRKIKEYSVDLGNLPLERVIRYASLDAYAHLRMFLYLRDRLRAEQLVENHEEHGTLWDYFQDVEVDVTKVLWRMERRGILVDRALLANKVEELDVAIRKAEMDINREAGKVVNMWSFPQLTKLFFGQPPDGMGLTPIKMTKKDMPSCDDDVLQELAGKIPLAKMIADARGLDKLQNTYFTALLKLAEYYQDHRVHPSFNQMGARTGRFSTSAPNSQNQPRPENDTYGIRSTFVAPPGYKLVVSDYAQLEMRIMAHMSGDQAMLSAILAGKDLHCFTASVMYNIPYEEIFVATEAKEAIKEAKKKGLEPVPLTDRQKQLLQYRQDAKAIGFGILYGAGPVKIGKELGIDKKEAKKKIDLYLKKAFPGVDAYIHHTIEFCVKFGYVLTISGRRRRLAQDIHNRDFAIRGHAEREAVNATIQGCKHQDSYMLTSMGMVRVRDLNPQQHTIFTKSGTTDQYIVHDTGVKPIIRVATTHGFELVSTEHKFFSYGGQDLVLTPTSHLQRGSFIVAGKVLDWPKRTPPPGKAAGSVVEAELIGCLCGDGTYTRDRDFSIMFGNDLEYGKYLQSLIEQCFGDIHRPISRCKGSRGLCYKISVTRKPARQRLSELGLTPASKDKKFIPSWLFTAPVTHRKALLRGLFDTDGGLASGGLHAMFTNTSKNLAEGFLILAMSLGFHGRVTPFKSNKGFKTAWRVCVVPEETEAFLQAISPRIPSKRNAKKVHHHLLLPPELVKDVFQMIITDPAWSETVIVRKELKNNTPTAGHWKKRINTIRVKKNFTKSEQAHVYRFKYGWGGTVESCDKFMKRLNCIYSKRWLNLMDLIHTPWARIRSISKEKAAPTKDIEILGRDHSYIGQGLLQHNSAADIVKHAMLRIEECPFLRARGVWMVNQIHDEIVVEVPIQYAEEVSLVIKRYMENPFGDDRPALKVPIPVDLHVADNWMEAK